MSASSRLPTPGLDDGTWGNILNDFLLVSHDASGSILPSAITAAGGGTYSKPAGGIPGGDLTAAVQANLAAATTAVQTVNTKAATSGNVSIGLRDLSDTSGVAGATNNQVLVYNSTTTKWTPNTVSSTTVSDATSGAKGILQLAGDLGGTAAAPTVPALATKIDAATVTTKGDLLVASATATLARVGVGIDGQFLTADSSQTTGVKWNSLTMTDTNAVHKGDLLINVVDYGAKIDGVKLAGVTSSTNSTAVSFSSSNFTSSDVGKLFRAYDPDNYGTLTTIQSVTDATHITLAANAGVTLTAAADGNGYYQSFAIYGTNDAPAIQSALNAAATALPGIGGDFTYRQDVPGGSPKVLIPGSTSKQGWSLLAAAVTVPSGVTLEAEAALANCTASAASPFLIFSEWTFSVGTLVVDCLNQGGIALGPTTLVPSHDAHVRADNIEVYRPGPTAVGLTLTGNWFRITSLVIHDAKLQGIQHSSGSDFWCGQAFLIGCTSPIILNASGQVTYERVYLDTCIATNGAIALNNGSKNIRMNIQAFENYSNTLDAVVSIGQSDTNTNFDLDFDITANSTGGAILKLAHAGESRFSLLGSNTPINSTYNPATPITTGIIYGSGLSSAISISATLAGTIQNYTGTLVGSLQNTQGTSFGTSNNMFTSQSLQVGSSTFNTGGGKGVLAIADAAVAPTTNPSGGGILYSVSGLPQWRDTTGAVHPLVTSGLYFNVKDYGAKGDGTTNDTTAIAAAITACNAASGGTVFFPSGTYVTGQLTLPSLVSLKGASRKGTVLQLAASAGTSLIISAGFSANTNGAGGSAWGAVSPTVPSYFTIENMTLDGNASNQPVPPARNDWRDDSALIKLWGYHMILRELELINACELALYTEHYGNWETTFNQYQFAESSFENIFAKNYWATGWVNRGPHDSSIRNVYLSAYTASGSYALYGYIQQGSGSNYSTGGTVANNLHVWGQHTQNAVYVDSSNIVEGWIYAEGSTLAAIKLVNAASCSFRAFVGYCSDGIELYSGSNNRIVAAVESNVSGSLFKLRASSGNNLEQAPGGNAVTAVFDLTTGAGNYTGGNNIFRTARPYATTLIVGTAATSDRIEAIADAALSTNRVTTWQLPVGASRVLISNTAGTIGSVDLGSLELIGSGARVAAITKTSAYTMTPQDLVVLGSATTAAFTITLPTAVGNGGKLFAVKKTDSSANAITVATTSSQTIDGITTASLAAQNNYLLVVSDGANWNILASSSSGGGSTPTNVQVFTSSGTWTKPAGAVLVDIDIIAGGGGGGAGRRGAAGSARYGGGGGGGGGHTRASIPASALAASVAVTVGTGGAGASAVATDDTSGSNGGAGTSTIFGTMIARGGGVGQGGTAALAAATANAGGGTFIGALGTATNVGSGNAGISGAGAASSGGGGGGLTTTNIPGAGGTAPSAWDRFAFVTLSGGSVPGGAGTKGTDRATTDIGGGDGGSGGAAGAADASSGGGVGGAGSFPGGGGGGGGASANTIASGAGGAGGAGIAVIITRF